MDKTAFIKKLVTSIESGRVKTIGIYGHGASGKSSFAKELYQALNPQSVNLLETDPYITSYRHLVVPKEATEQKVTACLPVAHELASLERDILALQNGMDLLTIEEPWKASEVLSGSKSTLIVEGMSVAYLPKRLFDLTICFYTDDETELERRLARDTTVRKREASFVRETHQIRRGQYRRYYQETEKEADVLINQSQNQFQIEKDYLIGKEM